MKARNKRQQVKRPPTVGGGSKSLTLMTCIRKDTAIMETIKIVAQNGHAWTEQVADKTEAKQRAKEVRKEHGDIERVELETQDGPETIWRLK